MRKVDNPPSQNAQLTHMQSARRHTQVGEDQHGSLAQQPHSQLHQLAGWQALLPAQSWPLLPACRRLPGAAGVPPGLPLSLPLLPLGILPAMVQLLAGE